MGRLVQDRTGQWQLLAFRNIDDGGWVGEITDPRPVRQADGRLEITAQDEVDALTVRIPS